MLCICQSVPVHSLDRRRSTELVRRLTYTDLNPCSKSGTELDLWSGKIPLTASQGNRGQQQLAAWAGTGNGQVSLGKIGKAVMSCALHQR